MKIQRLRTHLICRRTIFLISIVIITSLLKISAQEIVGEVSNPRIKLIINQGWQFHLGEVSGNPWEKSYDASKWELINVPHTLKLTSLNLDGCRDDFRQLTFQRDFGWYRRMIKLSGNEKNKVFLEFEGAHQVTDLWVNGTHVGQHCISGYTPFHFDITDYVKRNEDNLICLKVDNRRREDVPPDPGPFDYIKFSGLYRDVYLVETNPVHITFNWEDINAGIRITTPSVDPLNMNATINVETVITNDYTEKKECTLITRIIDKEGIVVLKMEQTANIIPGTSFIFNQCSGLEEDVHLWSCEDPYLYRVNSEVIVEGKLVDCLENRMGIRKIELNKHDGFLLNGIPVKMIGLNRHQHYLYIGDAVPNSLHYKDILQIKELGFNTVRTAHYPQDNALLDACDELGILVYEEPPSWISVGSEAWFKNYNEAARRMVRNHRNHPSVVIWGAGINHRGYVANAHYIIKQEDPTRFTASNNSEWTGLQASGACDIFSNMDYKGIPDWKQNEYLLAMEGSGGPAIVSKYKSNPLRIGLISWTAHAYYTFVGNSENATDLTRGGMMDIFRTPKSGYRGIDWYKSEAALAPIVYFTDDWKSDLMELVVYSNCQEVQLLINGKIVARQKPDNKAEYAGLRCPPFTFRISKYEAGIVEVLGIIDGEISASYKAMTPGKPESLKLVVDLKGRELTADGSDIVMVYAHVVDANGTMIKDKDFLVDFTVEGPASIVGGDAGIGSNPVMSKRGIAPVLVRAGLLADNIIIQAKAKGLKPAESTFTSVKFNPLVSTIKPFYDPDKIRVDLGGKGQIVQFGWKEWTGEETAIPINTFGEFGGFSASLDKASSKGTIQCMGEINVFGKFGFAIGDGILAFDPEGLVLRFEGLEKGTYHLKTYHYAPKASSNHDDPVFTKWNELKLDNIPFAEILELQSTGLSPVRVKVGNGNDLTRTSPGVAEIDFYSDGNLPVSILIKDPSGTRGIWLNCFELGQSFVSVK